MKLLISCAFRGAPHLGLIVEEGANERGLGLARTETPEAAVQLWEYFNASA